MGLPKVGLNISALGNIAPPNITIPTTGKEAIQQVPITANVLTLGYLGHILLTGFFILLYLILSDKSPLGEFRYSDLRAFTITSGIVTLFGLTLVQAEFISNFFIVGLSVTIFVIGNILLLKSSPSQ